MRPQYYTVGGSPKIIPVDTNVVIAQISIRYGGTVEFALEAPPDSRTSPNNVDPAVGPAPTWLAAPAPANGITYINFPVAALRLTGAGAATVLQQGLR